MTAFVTVHPVHLMTQNSARTKPTDVAGCKSHVGCVVHNHHRHLLLLLLSLKADTHFYHPSKGGRPS